MAGSCLAPSETQTEVSTGEVRLVSPAFCCDGHFRWRKRARYFHSGGGASKLVVFFGLTVSKKPSCLTWYCGDVCPVRGFKIRLIVLE